MGQAVLISKTLRMLSRYRKDERGNIAIIFALMLPLVVGGAALGVETSYWYLQRLQMQSAADAAAYAGAQAKRSGKDASTITATATRAATDNGYTVATGSTITVNTPPTSGTSGTQAVEVILQTTATRFFSQAFLSSSVNLYARAVAKYTNAGNACVLALNSSGSRTLTFSGSTDVTLNACSVMSNSVASDAAYVGGSAKVNTQCIISVGGVDLNNNVTQTCGSAITKAAPVADPFADLVWPTATGVNTSGTTYIGAGTYSSGLTLQGTVNMAGGNYFINGPFKINANAVVNCTTCSFYLGPNATMKFAGNATINLKAPTDDASGTMNSGILFAGDPAITATMKFLGDSSSHFQGDIYFKKANIEFQGNNTATNGCTHIVGGTVTWTGNASITASCAGQKTIPATYTVALSE